jgi:hypothetical protein
MSLLSFPGQAQNPQHMKFLCGSPLHHSPLKTLREAEFLSRGNSILIGTQWERHFCI